MKCHEILHDWPDGGPDRPLVCEATRFTEHTHAEPKSYIRPLKVGEYVTRPDAQDCTFLADAAGKRLA